ncbi:hypothetical protein OS493_003332 [Desmophyllum pertusum]|uniref:Uncharacterized protein n=1 Tax=Desmophyllum pertusum TaxID=174260 RepID=A0A9X0DBB7_9CNID|nr:hypothetical protein OS493_003332 [Desmophyllum pertusum]
MNVYTASTVLFVTTIALQSKATIADPKARVVEGNEKTDVQVFAPDQDEDLPNDPYMNYLKWPRIHFSGTFRAVYFNLSTTGPTTTTPRSLPKADELPNKEQSNWNPGGI